MGLFDSDMNPLAWFDESPVPEAWFDSDLIPTPALTGALVAAFVAVKPDYAHPPHGHDDKVAIATTDFLALALVVVAVLGRRRLRASVSNR
jgi:hypothetical protein